MNKNLFIYSFKYLAVLLALVTFSSCERDVFTEQDAFDLNQAQLDAQDAREQAALAAQDKRVMDMAMFRRSMDSLTRLNSGGKVFYTVNVVPGGSSAFSSGRFEEIEGLDGATVTVSQLGGAVVEQKTTVAGLASFEMYSGEVTVNVEAANHTDLNYTANLTPDGGVPNGALMYVGNVVPVFDDPNNPAAGSEENLATVKGFAFAELDITYNNNFEESVPDGTKVRAFIDVANPAFKTKYIDQANDETVNNAGQPTKSGYIQRFAYEEAASTTGSTVTTALNNDTAPEGGEYSITIGATASGLPIKMKFDDFAADRTYVFGGLVSFIGSGDNPDGDFGTGAKRFIYTQNTEAGGTQTQTPIPSVGETDLAPRFTNVNFSFVGTEATTTASITGGDVVRTITSGGVSYMFTGNALSNAVTGEIANAYLGDDNRGSYLTTPTVVFSAPPTGGVQATGVAIMGERNEGESTVNTSGTLTTSNDLRPVIGVRITNPGSGYTTAPTVRFVRNSFTGKTAAGVPNANGNGTIVSTQSGIGYVEIINSGFGYTNPAGAAPFIGTGPTGVNPTALFNNAGAQVVGETPTGGTAASGVVVVDRAVGVVTQIDIPVGSAGSGYTTPIVTVVNGEGSSVTDGDANTFQGGTANTAGTTVFFETDGTGGLRFATATNATVLGVGTTDGITLSATGATKFALVPGVSVTGTPSAASGSAIGAGPFTLPTLSASVDANGNLIDIQISNRGTGYTNVAAEADRPVGGLTLRVLPRPSTVTATAFVSSGGGVGNYVLANYGTPQSIYSTTLGTNFNYVTATTTGAGLQEFRDKNNNIVTPANIAINSDYKVVFAAPAGAGAAASGYPIFEQGGANLVGIYIANAGSGYTSTEAPSYWVIPAGLSLAEYADGTAVSATNTNNASATGILTGKVISVTFTNGGIGYAVRPEFIISGGNKSAEDLAAINAGLNTTLRAGLTFNGAGTITNTTALTHDFSASGVVFSDADLAAQPIVVTPSVARLQGTFSALANQFVAANGQGRVEPNTAGNGVDYTGTFRYTLGAGATTALATFNSIEGNAAFNGALNGTYISAPSYTITFAGLDTGGEGVAVLSANTADITGLAPTAAGSLPSGLIIDTFFDLGNDPFMDPAGEPFRTIGGPSSFEVFSGLTYIRDVNYGTGIELE